MSRDETIAWLVRVIQTGAGSVEPGDSICQSVKHSHYGREISIPCKLGAVAQLAKMCSWNEPEKFEHSAGDELRDLLMRLRGG